MKHQDDLLERLSDFEPGIRDRVLDELSARPSVSPRGAGTNVNMHFHSFFSYNAEGWSPSRIAWEASRRGLYAAGLCDFDVLDGLEEFLRAGRKLGLRAAVHLETRAFFKEYAGAEISSPGEPGVTYIMGGGFARMPPAGTDAAAGLAGYRSRAQERNVALLGRINASLPEITLDYGKDVLPLTPLGVATERHIIAAYVNKAMEVFEHPRTTAEFWARVLGKDFDAALELLADRSVMEEVVRGKLAKRGGLGYEQPSAGTFPLVDEFIRWVRLCEAIPMVTWLDGTSAGEADGKAMLECLCAKGAAALNIIPDRNWNLADPRQRALKLSKLNEIVAQAAAMNLPINIGTEMNKTGLPFADDLDGEALRPHRELFIRGARLMVGHSVLSRYAGFSYTAARAAAEYPDVQRRNAFFEAVGTLPPLTEDRARRLEEAGPDKALALLAEAAAVV